MENIDAINCLFLWNNRTNDTFMCTDTWFDGNRQPVTTPEAQDAKNVRTGLVNVKAGSFQVSYQRAFKTSDPITLDYVFNMQKNEFIFSFGSIQLGAAQEHNNADRGIFTLNFETGEYVQSFGHYLKGFAFCFMIASLVLFM